MTRCPRGIRVCPARMGCFRSTLRMNGSDRGEAVLRKVASLIHEVRSQRVMLDEDLAVLYGVSTKALNQAVRRNAGRFLPTSRLSLSAKRLAT